MERNKSTGFENVRRRLKRSWAASRAARLRRNPGAPGEPNRAIFFLPAALLLLAPACQGAGIYLSSTGTLDTPEDYFVEVFTLSATSNVEIDTWSFGGGTNAAGTVIPAGGFDPSIALFSGDVASASIFTVSGNPAADADTLGGYVGNCPPAGMVTIGTGAGSSVCGDDTLSLPGLPAGTYTLVLSDANNIPYAVDPGPPVSSLLSDGFGDLTGGVFQTCNMTSDGTFCITPTANFAVDIVQQSGSELEDVEHFVEHPSDEGSATPEPAAAVLAMAGLAGLGMLRKINRNFKGGTKCSS
jgi:MYXO-CTERM domain-containing protein